MSIDPGFIKVNDWPILLMVINHKKNVSVSLFKNVRLFIVVVFVIHSLMSIELIRAVTIYKNLYHISWIFIS